MKSFIRRKSSKTSVKSNPVQQQPVVAPPPRIPSPIPSLDANTPPPLYARFARGDITPDFRTDPNSDKNNAEQPPKSPNLDIQRPRALGSGFRSSSVDEELSVVKKTAGSIRSGLSVRTTHARPLSPPISPTERPVTVVVKPILPRPPTPPPPSPIKPSYSATSPARKPAQTRPVMRPVTPPRAPPPAPATPPIPASPPATAPLTPPATSFTSPRRAYSPLAAFGPLRPKVVVPKSPNMRAVSERAVSERAVSPPPPTPSPPPAALPPAAPPPAAPSLVAPSLVAPPPAAPPSPQSPNQDLQSPFQELYVPDPPLPTKRSPEFGPGLASQLRAASRSGTRDGVSPSRQSPTSRPNTAPTMRPGTGSNTPGSVSGYFALYPDRERGRTKARGGLLSPESSEDGHGASAMMPDAGHASTVEKPEKRSRGSASARMQERQARWAGGVMVGGRRSPVLTENALARSRSRPREDPKPADVSSPAPTPPPKPSTPVAAAPGLPSTQPAVTASTLSSGAFPLGTPPPSARSPPVLEDDLQAFASGLPVSFVSGLPSSLASSDVPAAFGEVSKRVPRGTRLSQLGASGGVVQSTVTGAPSSPGVASNNDTAIPSTPSTPSSPAPQPPFPPPLEREHSSDAQSTHSSHSHSSRSSKHLSMGEGGRWRPKSRDREKDKDREEERRRSASRKLKKGGGVENIAIPPVAAEEPKKLKKPGTPTNGNIAGVGAGGGKKGHKRKGSAFELDEDPFARLEPVTPVAKSEDGNGYFEEAGYSPTPKSAAASLPSTNTGTGTNTPNTSTPSLPTSTSNTSMNTTPSASAPSTSTLIRTATSLPTPISPEEAAARLLRREIKPPVDTDISATVLHPRVPISPHKRTGSPVKLVSPATPAPSTTALVPVPTLVPTGTYPLYRHISHPFLLFSLLQYLAYADFTALLVLDKRSWRALTEVKELREEVLERYLRTVGYRRWSWAGKEALILSLKDLNAYLRGVSTPMHEYATIADAYIAQSAEGPGGIPSSRVLRAFAASCRSFTRLVLRLRLQAEAEHKARTNAATYPGSRPTTGGAQSRRSSVQTQRDSATISAVSHGESSNSHALSQSSHEADTISPTSPKRFASPLFRLHHAPLLRLFVPSPNGAWLSDESVVECERELKRAGVLHVLRAGDVVWDTAVLDEGNAGRLIWDGNYLIDLDYNYSTGGELPRYMHSLAFPPSYFHKVIRSAGNPLCQIDVSPWGTEIAHNLQLLQDRVVTDTPQGSHHTVLRWTHRSRFHIHARQPIPNSDGRVVDAKWAGAVVVEAEGTNEGLADLMGRCGEAAAGSGVTVAGGLASGAGAGEGGRVFRLLRDRSRPGEIWLRCVREKERIA